MHFSLFHFYCTILFDLHYSQYGILSMKRKKIGNYQELMKHILGNYQELMKHILVRNTLHSMLYFHFFRTVSNYSNNSCSEERTPREPHIRGTDNPVSFTRENSVNVSF